MRQTATADITDSEFDYIVVGGGSAGCVMANRLSADPTKHVLLIERGGGSDHWLVRMPKGFGKLLADPERVSYFPTSHRRGPAADIPDVWVRGKLLGGSSSVNGMVWIRGQMEDYDRIGQLGNAGWSWDSIAPYFKKLENHAFGEDEWRGVGGPIDITDHPAKSALGDAVIASGEALGLRRKQDQNRLEQEGIGYLQFNIDRRGQRVTAARAFLDPIRHRANLTIVTDAQVERLNCNARRRVESVSARIDGRRQVIRCSGEVILCAGTIDSPRLLQLSGIGPANLSNQLNIPVVCDIPAVGRHVHEHWLLAINRELTNESLSYNRQFGGANLIRNLASYAFGHRGVMAWGSNDLCAFVRTSPELARPDAQLMFSAYSLDLKTMGFLQKPGAQMFGYVLRPVSEGSINIVSPDPAVLPRIEPNYLSAPEDQRASIAMIRYIRKLLSQAPLAGYLGPEWEGTAGAQSDEQILDAVRQYGQVGYHATGSCRMGQSDDAVVDERLRVKGMQNLRVVDCSIFPEMISGNTNAPTMAMAWFASDLIQQDKQLGAVNNGKPFLF